MARTSKRARRHGFPALHVQPASLVLAMSVSLAVLLIVSATNGSAFAETPREEKQIEEAEEPAPPVYTPQPSRTNQQQERQDRVRPAPVREHTKPNESQQDARKRRNKDRALSQ